jgi:hypothetical protein
MAVTDDEERRSVFMEIPSSTEAFCEGFTLCFLNERV